MCFRTCVPNDVSGRERAHAMGEGARPGAEQKVGVIRQERPGVHGERPPLHPAREAREELGAIGVIPEDGRPLDALHHDMVQGAGRIQPWPAGYRRKNPSTSRPTRATLRALPRKVHKVTKVAASPSLYQVLLVCPPWLAALPVR